MFYLSYRAHNRKPVWNPPFRLAGSPAGAPSRLWHQRHYNPPEEYICIWIISSLILWSLHFIVDKLIQKQSFIKTLCVTKEKIQPSFSPGSKSGTFKDRSRCLSNIQVNFQTLLSGLKPATKQAGVSTRWEVSGQKKTLFVRVDTVAPVRTFHLGNVTQLLTKGQRVTSPPEPRTFSFQNCRFNSFSSHLIPYPFRGSQRGGRMGEGRSPPGWFSSSS